MVRMGIVCLFAGLTFACSKGSGERPALTAEDAASTRPAVPVNDPRPEYPSDEREKAIESAILVHYTVLEDGSVANIRASESSPFAVAAIDAVERWEFEPALRDRRPIASERASRFVFRLSP